MTDAKHRDRLVTLLKELFQLDKPELDFGLYKIMHARAERVTQFLEHDLLAEIEAAFGEVDSSRIAEAKAAYEAKRAEAESLGAPNPDEAPAVEEAKAAWEAAKDGGNSETEIYDHLYRFFERYYDKGDFMSRRYYARESASRAAPYAVPYDGREVYLHWANKDQYYIKSSDYLTNYSFDLNEAARQVAKSSKGSQKLDFDQADDTPLKVHFRIVDGSEGEHDNIKEADNDKRKFMPFAERPAEVNEDGELVLNFQYKALPGGKYDFDEATIKQQYGNLNKGDMPHYWMANTFLEAIDAVDELPADYGQQLRALAPTDKQKKRPLLVKYINKYTSRHTMDYFIHKDLGGFLRRELDFYIKNEIMQLDAIEQADAPQVESYLAKIKVLRRIAHQLIDFLAQLENFQKKLWLKKKFVTETNYGITLDRVPESLYAEIAANNAQRREWCELFHIEDIQGDMHSPAYSEPLTVEFLKANPFLVLDTKHFSADFKARLINEIDDFDAQCDGVLVHSENFQALGLVREKFVDNVKCVYVDPPYNTSEETFDYKNQYQHSSWLTMMAQVSVAAKTCLSASALYISAIDDAELYNLKNMLDSVFRNGYLGTLAIQTNPRGRGINSHFATSHDYSLVYGCDSAKSEIQDQPLSEDQEGEFKHGDSISAFRWLPFRRSGGLSTPNERPNSEFPLFFDNESKLVGVGGARTTSATDEYSADECLVYGSDGIIEKCGFDDPRLKGCTVIYPLDKNNERRVWRWSDRKKILEHGKDGSFCISKAGSVLLKDRSSGGRKPKTLWFDSKYDGSSHGTNFIKDILGDRNNFSYPKAFSNTEDCLFCAIGNDKHAITFDPFGGSGTTGHSVININRKFGGNRSYVIAEVNNYFDTVLKPRIAKVVYSESWKDGKPVPPKGKKAQNADNPYNGISHCFKYIRLESYEDALNNLVLREDADRDRAIENNANLRRDYLLNYFLDVETQGSQSLLNVGDFRDPTAYKMHIKQPGSDEAKEQTIDLVETFNWLIGLWVEHLAAPQTFAGEFKREEDPQLPDDENTRLVCTRLKNDADGDYWFRLVEGYTLKVPGDKSSKSPTLIIWRKLTDDAEADNAALQEFLRVIGVSTREHVYDTIYVNGSHTLPNPVVDGEHTKVKLLEEAFHHAMWAEAE